MRQKKKLVVPIVFDLYDYHKEKPALSWVFEMYTNYCVNNGTAIIAQEDYFKQEINPLNKTYRTHVPSEERKKDLNKKKLGFAKYQISNKEVLEINKGKKASFEDQVFFMSHVNNKYKEIIKNKLDKIEKDYKQKINGIFTWYWNPSLDELAKERGIVLISQEISPIRDLAGNTYRITLCYFQFFSKYDNSYCKNLYSQFLIESKKENLRIFSRDELLGMLLKTKDIKLLSSLDKPTKYELGFSPPIENDFYFEVYKNQGIRETLKKINGIFIPSSVSIRYRLDPIKNFGDPSWDIDTSEKSTYWILKCKRILTYVSNIAFDAMLFGKTVYLLSDSMPFSFMSINQLKYKDESVVETKYLNFMIFGYFIPWDLMLDQEYIEWRLTNPSIIEIYKKNQDYIFKAVGLNTNKKITLQRILIETHNLDKKAANDILSYSEYLYLESLQDLVNKLKQEVLEFSAFKKGRIWKSLEKYRKIKKTLLKK